MERLTTHDELKQPWVIPANERTWRDIYKKLAAYEDAEENGLLLKLFVPYGTEIFYIDQSIGYGLHGVKHYGKPFVAKKEYLWDVIFDWNKSTILYKTKEEAESALAAMEGQREV